jgi:chromosome partitioning protein
MAKAVPATEKSGAVVAFTNLKGGAGKTTLAVNIAAALAGKEGPVILVDADAQATSVAWGVAGRLPVRIEALPIGGEGGKALEGWLARLVAFRREAVITLVDLPPNLGGVTTAALAVADLALVPVPASGLDIQATGKALELIRRAREVRKSDRPVALLVPSRIDRRTASGREIEAVLSDFREMVAPAVTQRAAHVDAFGAGQWIGDYARGSTAHAEIEAVAALVRRIVTR